MPELRKAYAIHAFSIVRSGNATTEQPFPISDASNALPTDGNGSTDLLEGTKRHIR